MASKNLLPVVALCGALATGMPVAAWATPVMADSLPVALSPAPDPSSTIMCKRFSLKQATILDSRGYRALEYGKRIPGRLCRLHMAFGCA